MDENKKPRICEILGVEPLEEWRIKDDPDNALYRFNGNAREVFRYGQWQPRQLEEVLLRLIENPDLIQHKPRWTKDDVEDAKALLRILPNAVSIKRMAALEPGQADILRINYDSGDYFFVKNVGDVCPSAKFEETVTLAEILEADVDD